MKLERNGLEKFFNFNLTKFKISDNLFIIQRKHNLFWMYSFSYIHYLICYFVNLHHYSICQLQ